METIALILATLIFNYTIQESYYDLKKHESCPEEKVDTNRVERKECYILKDEQELEELKAKLDK